MAEETPTTPAADSPQAAPSQEGPSPSAPTTSPAETVTSTDPGQSKETLLDAVLKVVPATTETDVLAKDPTDTTAPPEAEQPEDKDQAEEPETEGEDDEAPPAEASPATRKKINKLLKQRRELRHQVAQLERPAQIGSELETFAQQNDLSTEDITNTLQIAALLRAGDYAGFYKAVSKYVRTAQEVLGIVLPADLANEVRRGQMTEAAARNFARQRHLGQRAEIERQQLETIQQQTTRQYVQSDIQRAVTTFEQRLAARDPDYKAKAPAVRRAAQALLFERGGTIQSLEEAIAITREAYDEVNRHFRSFTPRPVATAPKPNGAAQTPSARAAPKTLMEAALQGLENARRAGG